MLVALLQTDLSSVISPTLAYTWPSRCRDAAEWTRRGSNHLKGTDNCAKSQPRQPQRSSRGSRQSRDSGRNIPAAMEAEFGMPTGVSPSAAAWNRQTAFAAASDRSWADSLTGYATLEARARLCHVTRPERVCWRSVRFDCSVAQRPEKPQPQSPWLVAVPRRTPVTRADVAWHDGMFCFATRCDCAGFRADTDFGCCGRRYLELCLFPVEVCYCDALLSDAESKPVGVASTDLTGGLNLGILPCGKVKVTSL